eukprot:CAMPEP_0114150102 /NCGR_PEP_ID=MMETSP0043_2-20121206/22523_1 /TAXON_ID=464988 /ORGANISM="Hemiselmis andersenii, Strain CCMP644" /LENGTH=70 /DNA_ID=CAMNT_0001244809 /DNA_START=187 /DNA_END=397 /DNA_ORIENTATION=-
MTDGASASLPFEQLSKFKNGFEREAMLANDKLLRRDAVIVRAFFAFASTTRKLSLPLLAAPPPRAPLACR